MSSVTDYFERMHRKEHLNPSSHWFTIMGGILFFLAGAFFEIRSHKHSQALSYATIGLGMAMFGLTQDKLRNSSLRVPALLLEFALWVGGLYWLLHTMF